MVLSDFEFGFDSARAQAKEPSRIEERGRLGFEGVSRSGAERGAERAARVWLWAGPAALFSLRGAPPLHPQPLPPPTHFAALSRRKGLRAKPSTYATRIKGFVHFVWMSRSGAERGAERAARVWLWAGPAAPFSCAGGLLLLAGGFCGGFFHEPFLWGGAGGGFLLDQIGGFLQSHGFGGE